MVRYLGRTGYVHIKKLLRHKSDCLLRSPFLTSLVFCEICCVLLCFCIMDWASGIKPFFFFFCLLLECSSSSLPSGLGINKGTAIGSSCHWFKCCHGPMELCCFWYWNSAAFLEIVVLISSPYSMGETVLRAFFSADAQL